MQTLNCPHCGATVEVPDGAGHRMTCVHCSQQYLTPDSVSPFFPPPLPPQSGERPVRTKPKPDSKSTRPMPVSTSAGKDGLPVDSENPEDVSPSTDNTAVGIGCLILFVIGFIALVTQIHWHWFGAIIIGIATYFVLSLLIEIFLDLKDPTLPNAIAASISLLITVAGFVGNQQLHPRTTPQHKYPATVNDERRDTSEGVTNIPPRRPAPAPAQFNRPLVALPQNGATEWYTNADRPAKLTIKTPYGSEHHYIKLVSAVRERVILTVFIRAGETADVQVPVGIYKFRYVTGKDWYGKEFLFGPDTGYFKTDKFHRFVSRIKGNFVESTHITIELVKQLDGNLSTSEIAPEEW